VRRIHRPKAIRPATAPPRDVSGALARWHAWGILVLLRVVLRAHPERALRLPAAVRDVLHRASSAGHARNGSRSGPSRESLDAEIAGLAVGSADAADCPIRAIVARHGLSPDERDVLAFLATHATSQPFVELCQALKLDGIGAEDVSIGFLLEALFPGAPPARQVSLRGMFHPSSPLRICEILEFGYVWRLEEPKLSLLRISLHPRLANQVLGDDRSYVLLSAFVEAAVAQPRVGRVILPGDAVRRVLETVGAWRERRASGRAGEGLSLLFYGPPGTGKTLLAEHVSATHGLPLIRPRIRGAQRSLPKGRLNDGDDASIEELVPLVLREARALGGIAFFDECDDVFTVDSRVSRCLLIELERHGGLAIMATNSPRRLDPALDRRATLRLPFPLPTRVERRELWHAHLEGIARLAPDVDTEDLANRFFLAGGYIRNAAGIAMLRAGEEGEIAQGDLIAAAEEQKIRFAEDLSSQIVSGPHRMPAVSARTLARLDGLERVARDAVARGVGLRVRLQGKSPEDLRAVTAAMAWRLRMGVMFHGGAPKPDTEEESPTRRAEKQAEADLANLVGLLPNDCLLAVEDRTGDSDLTPVLAFARLRPVIFLLLDGARQRRIGSEAFHLTLGIEPPDGAACVELWQRALSAEGVSGKDIDAQALAARWVLRESEIHEAARRARWQALADGRGRAGWADVLRAAAEVATREAVPVVFGE